MSQSKFKTVEAIKNNVKVFYIEKTSYAAASLEEQLDLVTSKVKEGFEINVCEFPTVSLSDVDSIIKAYSISPSLVTAVVNTSVTPKTVEEVEIVNNFNNALVVFNEAYSNFYDLIAGSYKFQSVPSNFKLENNFIFLNSRVRRKHNSEHFLENEDFKSLFNICFDYWVSGLNDPLNLTYVSLTRHSLRRDITIDSNSIRIGCQTVRRYEFEQIAIQLGFRGEKFTNVRKLKYKS